MTGDSRKVEEYNRWLERTGIEVDSATKQGMHDTVYSNSAAADAYEEAEEFGVDVYPYIIWKLGWDHHVEGWAHSEETGWVELEDSHQEVQEIFADATFDEEPASEQVTLDDTTKRGRTREEQRIIDTVARHRGEQWAEEHAELILTQARLVGELSQSEQ